MPEMIFHERGNKVVAVVVTIVPPQFECHAGLATGLLQEVRMQLLFQELVGKPLIDEDRVLGSAAIQ